MKKIYILTAIALVAGVSCTKQVPADNNSPDVAIGFSPISQRATTKAALHGEQTTDYTLGTSPNYEQFTVFAAWTENTYTDASAVTAFMAGDYNKDRCIFDKDNNTWKPKQTYYWPKNGYLTFAAFSPADAKDDAAISYDWTTGFVFDHFKVQADIKKQYDLMYTSREYNKRRSDYTDASPYDDDDQSVYKHNGVNLLFNHALSSIKIKVRTKAEYAPNATIKITSMSILNAFSKAKFSENVTDGATYAAAPAWTEYDEKTNYLIMNTSQVVNYNSGTAQDLVLKDGASAILLLPQDLTEGTDKPTLHIEYTIEQNDGSAIAQTTEFVLHNFAHGTGDAQRKWLMGKRYIYNIIFGLDEIYFDPAVVDWTEYTVNPDPEV